MSVTTSPANVDPPPLLFGAHTSTHPPLTSQRLSPTDSLDTSNTHSSQNLHSTMDVEMSATVRPPRPPGHDHDTDENGGPDQDRAGPHSQRPEDGSRQTHADQGDGVNDDVMDTTPDGSPTPRASDDGDHEAGETGREGDVTSVSPPELDSNESITPPPLPPADAPPAPTPDNELTRIDSNGRSISSGPDIDALLSLPAVQEQVDSERFSGSDPPSPRVDGPTGEEDEGDEEEEGRHEEDSEDDEDAGLAWHELPEDTSVPDETEIREMEETGEVSALDHAHWEGQIFPHLEDPEYKPGASGRIEWKVTKYNGTADSPNKELLMKSHIVRVGGYDWQIKFYPKGNNSDWLSVYISCVSLESNKRPVAGDIAMSGDDAPKGDSTMHDGGESSERGLSPAFQPTPIPPLDANPPLRRPSVAAQVGVVLYNPSEPRVWHFKAEAHRFSSRSSDWGWTRFCGPQYQIHQRQRRQRQALLRNDTLAFTAYVRIVKDETGCFAEHPTVDNPWNSLAMTGLHGLSAPQGFGMRGGNVISAISSWMLLRPFRQLLYDVRLPDPVKEPWLRPKPVLQAFQRLLYGMRTHYEPLCRYLSLEGVVSAFEWYGIELMSDKLDVIRLWEIMRAKIEYELADHPAASPLAGRMTTLFGVEKDRHSGAPAYKIPVRGMQSVQHAIGQTEGLVHELLKHPQVLHLELDRQYFDTNSRKWTKVVKSLHVDDSITIKGVNYVLYGFIVHSESLQSGLYYPVLRPGGPGTKWYSYKDGRDGNRVVVLPKREAVDAHEGCNKAAGTAAVAYIVMYVRTDCMSRADGQDATEPWAVPDWLVEDKSAETDREAAFWDVTGTETSLISGTAGEAPVESVELRIIESRAFMQHEGLGTIDLYNPDYSPGRSPHVYDITVDASASKDDLAAKMTELIEDVQDPRRCRFWIVNSIRGNHMEPLLFSESDWHGNWTVSKMKELSTDRILWLHVLPATDLPPILKEPGTAATAEQPVAPDGSGSGANSTTHEGIPNPSAPPQANNENGDEDTVMSDTEGGIVRAEADGGAQNATTTAMANSGPPAEGDTEMGGVNEPIPPPPPPLDLRPPPPPGQPGQAPSPTINGTNRAPRVPPPPPARDEAYFFLKIFRPEAVKLIPVGSYVAKEKARVDQVVIKILGLPANSGLNLYKEDTMTALPIRRRRSFAQEDVWAGAIIIVSVPPAEELQNLYSLQGAFSHPPQYVSWRREWMNFPLRQAGHVTLDYFSAEPYTGTLTSGLYHGHGHHISFAGHVYCGSFVLGKRHGRGLMTFPNGDTYDGDWVDGQQHGQGTFVEAATGNTYVGGWKKDKRFGVGVTQWKVAQEAEHMCKICWDAAAEAAFYDCGHVMACMDCARRMDICPVCRKKVVSVMKLFYGG